MGRTQKDGQSVKRRENLPRFYIGIGLIALGLFMPRLVTVEGVGLYDVLRKAIYREEEIYVLLAALQLVGVNALRSYPHYLGVFFLAESFNDLPSRWRSVLSTTAVCLVIPGIYVVIEWIYGIHYDFGIPAVSMVTITMLLAKIDFSFVSLWKKTMMVAFLLTSLQFLDMMPMLWSFPFGRGESSYDIRMVSEFLGADSFLQGMSTIFFLLLLLMAILLLLLILDENNIRRISEQKEQNERMLVETRMQALENRTYMELQHLVHDLKSPLTSMQALVGVVKLRFMDEPCRELEYLGYIEDSIERMSSMISEILHGEHRGPVTTRMFLNAVMAQVSAADYVDLIRTENLIPEVKIKVNKIRFSRVLVNLIENAAYAVKRPEGTISVCVDKTPDGGGVRFTVKDNGSGIPEELMSEIWKKGFSGRNSSGFGLSFVEEVVQQSGGTVTINSTEGVGTEAVVTLPIYEEEERYDELT